MTLISRDSTLRLAPFAAGFFLLAACGGDDGAPDLVDDDGVASTGSATSGVTASTTTDPTSEDESSSGFVPLCQPGELRCANDDSGVEVCAATGLEWVVDLACGSNSVCQPCEDGDDDCTVPTCIGPCQLTENDPSSAGCAFVVNRSLHPYQEFADGLVITNPNEELSAAVQLFEVPEGVLDEELFEQFNLAPGESRTIELVTDFVPGNSTNLRTGGIFRVYSDVPVVAYQHAPLRANNGNESALLLPDRVLGNDYVVPSYTSVFTNTVIGVSYFELVALEDDTRVEWTPPVTTAGNGLPVDPVEAGQTGSLVLNRYETLRVVPSVLGLPVEPGDDGYVEAFEPLDISGTVIHTDNPVWVSGGNKASRVPLDEPGQGGSADPLIEVVFPLQHWGRTYVMPAAPIRPYEFDAFLPEWQDFEEASYYRLYAGASDVTINSDPPSPNFPVTLDNVGDFVEIETESGLSLVVAADRPFLPVQYIRSKNPVSPNGGEGPPQTGYGDSAMVQLVPTEQFLSRYVFATGVDFYYNSVEIMRPTKGGEVRITSDAGNIIRVCNDADCDFSFSPVGAAYELALVPLEEGTYTASSDVPFGTIQFGSARSAPLDSEGIPLDPTCASPNMINCNTTYAYPGGLKAESIFIP